MKRYYLFLLSTFLSFHSFSQNLQQEIEALHSTEAVNNYWDSLVAEDQRFRGRHSIDSLDNLHFKKAIILIKTYGTLPGNKHDDGLFVVFVHQQSYQVYHHYFSLYHHLWSKGKIDTGYFYHILRALHHSKYGRGFGGYNANAPDIDTLLKRVNMRPFDSLTFDVSIFDSLYNIDRSFRQNIMNSTIVDIWETKEKFPSNWILFQWSDKFFMVRYYSDFSFMNPREVSVHKENNILKITYPDNVGNDFFIAKRKKLEVYSDGEREEILIKKKEKVYDKKPK